MSQLERFGVSMEGDLLKRFDDRIALKGYRTRSEAIRDLVRQELVESAWEQPNALVFGTVTLIYDHHARGLSEVLAELQHDHHASILCTTHVHVDAHSCLEVIIVKGTTEVVRRIADALIATKGVQHGHLVCSAVG
ncbi:nickel-responsive transcriptional regulator NikR [Holophaga foetida]|uniref:nickel-responsive transcriptional regulator NikR n=1 Tax=Holophaga foetida TaxID=35839 RepID=UPI0002474688|nr:nickel-responsive transcriptional regulator NikR [Holophaga foetida]